MALNEGIHTLLQLGVRVQRGDVSAAEGAVLEAGNATSGIGFDFFFWGGKEICEGGGSGAGFKAEPKSHGYRLFCIFYSSILFFYSLYRILEILVREKCNPSSPSFLKGAYLGLLYHLKSVSI